MSKTIFEPLPEYIVLTRSLVIFDFSFAIKQKDELWFTKNIQKRKVLADRGIDSPICQEKEG